MFGASELEERKTDRPDPPQTRNGAVKTVKTMAFDGVLIVGGGYAGLHAATALDRAGVPMSVVDADSVHGFITRLAGVAAGTVPEGDAFAPFRELGFSVAEQRVCRVDDGRVTFDDGTAIEASSVIVAAGSVAATTARPRHRARRDRFVRLPDALGAAAEGGVSSRRSF